MFSRFVYFLNHFSKSSYGFILSQEFLILPYNSFCSLFICISSKFVELKEFPNIILGADVSLSSVYPSGLYWNDVLPNFIAFQSYLKIVTRLFICMKSYDSLEKVLPDAWTAVSIIAGVFQLELLMHLFSLDLLLLRQFSVVSGLFFLSDPFWLSIVNA